MLPRCFTPDSPPQDQLFKRQTGFQLRPTAYFFSKSLLSGLPVCVAAAVAAAVALALFSNLYNPHPLEKHSLSDTHSSRMAVVCPKSHSFSGSPPPSVSPSPLLPSGTRYAWLAVRSVTIMYRCTGNCRNAATRMKRRRRVRGGRGAARGGRRRRRRAGGAGARAGRGRRPAGGPRAGRDGRREEE